MYRPNRMKELIIKTDFDYQNNNANKLQFSNSNNTFLIINLLIKSKIIDENKKHGINLNILFRLSS